MPNLREPVHEGRDPERSHYAAAPRRALSRSRASRRIRGGEPPEAEAGGPQVPKGLFIRCHGCSAIVYGRAIREHLDVCPRCDFHLAVSARDRVEMLADDGEYRVLSGGIRSNDPLEFHDRLPYGDRLRKGYATTGLEDAVLVVRTRIERTPVVLAFMAETAERHPSRRKRTARSAPDQEATGARCSPTEIPSIPRDRSRQTALSTIHGRLTTMVLYKPFPAPAYRLFRLTKRFRNSGPALFAL